jgi:simple sugar transport system permease protein
MQVDAGVSIDMISIIQALIIVFVAAPLLVKQIVPAWLWDRASNNAAAPDDEASKPTKDEKGETNV